MSVQVFAFFLRSVRRTWSADDEESNMIPLLEALIEGVKYDKKLRILHLESALLHAT